MKRLVLTAVGLTALALPGSALARDRNHDGIPDRWEARFHLSTTRNVANRDPDSDGLTNRREFRDGTNPRKSDTDGDGIGDGHDGTPDGNDIAGHVSSFDGKTLVITLNDGSSLTGAVTPGTEIKCETPPSTTASVRDHGGDSGDSADDGDRTGSSDNSGPGTAENQAGDDETAEQAGDDETAEQAGENDAAENQQGDDDGQDGQANCSTADLTSNAVVHQASLELTGSGPVFEEVELVK